VWFNVRGRIRPPGLQVAGDDDRPESASPPNSATGQENSPGVPDSEIISHGDRCYSIGSSETHVVTEGEDEVLRAFLKLPNMDLETIKDKSGNRDPANVLKCLEKKYKGIFAPAIRRPGGKGQGGYRVRVVRVST